MGGREGGREGEGGGTRCDCAYMYVVFPGIHKQFETRYLCTFPIRGGAHTIRGGAHTIRGGVHTIRGGVHTQGIDVSIVATVTQCV